MQDLPNIGHSGLALEIGVAVSGAMAKGVSADEAIATLDHLANLARLNKAMQVDFASLGRRVPLGTFAPRIGGAS